MAERTQRFGSDKARANAIAYNNKYNSEHYDRCNIMLPKGTKERIRATGENLNSFVSKLVLAELEKLESES